MGTNYYTAENYCDHCKQYKVDLHIGKSSGGWCFSFQGYKWMSLTSWQAWKAYLKDKLIMDEYGEKMTYESFVDLIEKHKAPSSPYVKFQHNDEGRKKGWFNPEYDWDDAEGFPFCSREFS